MIDYSQGYDTQLMRHYYRITLPELLRLKIYEPDLPQNLLVYQLVADSMDNIMENHPLYKAASIQFLKNVDKRLDFWLDLIDPEIKSKVNSIIANFLDEYEQAVETQ